MTAADPTALREALDETVEAGCIAVYGKNWNSPDDQKRPGEPMKRVWRDMVAKAQSPALAERDALQAQVARMAEALKQIAYGFCPTCDRAHKADDLADCDHRDGLRCAFSVVNAEQVARAALKQQEAADHV